MAVTHKEIEIVRDYKSLLRVSTGTFKDQVTSNSWSIVGSASKFHFDKFDSIFNELIEENDKCMTIDADGGYLQCSSTLSLPDNIFSMGFWFSPWYPEILHFYNKIDSKIPFFQFQDGSGNTCSIFLREMKADHYTEHMRIKYNNDEYITDNPFPFEMNQWYFFVYVRLFGEERIYIDGQRMFTINTETSHLQKHIKNIKIGNFLYGQNATVAAIAVDEFFVMNTPLTMADDYYRPTSHIDWIYPELEYHGKYKEEDDQYQSDIQLGGRWYLKSSTSPKKVTGGLIKFHKSMIWNPYSMLFMNGKFVDSSRYEIITREPFTIQLTKTADINNARKADFTLVNLMGREQLFEMTVEEVTTSAAVSNITISKDCIQRKDAIIIFDEDKGIVDPSKYSLSGKTFSFTSPVGGSGKHLTFICVNRRRYFYEMTKVKTRIASQLINEQINFKRVKFTVPSGRTGVAFANKPIDNYDLLRHGTMIVFVNGRYMNPREFYISDLETRLEVKSKPDDLIPANAEVIGLVIDSELIHPNNDANHFYQITGSSWFTNLVDNMYITRRSDFEPPLENESLMYQKIQFYKNNKVPCCNFDYIDKFGIEFKEGLFLDTDPKTRF